MVRQPVRGCLGVSGSGVSNGAGIGGRGYEVPQWESWDVIGIGGDYDNGKGVSRREGVVADTEG